jgi:hypothetical protein
MAHLGQSGVLLEIVVKEAPASAGIFKYVEENIIDRPHILKGGL